MRVSLVETSPTSGEEKGQRVGFQEHVGPTHPGRLRNGGRRCTKAVFGVFNEYYSWAVVFHTLGADMSDCSGEKIQIS